jgi:flagellar biosynthesis chaperone FliJ
VDISLSKSQLKKIETKLKKIKDQENYDSVVIERIHSGIEKMTINATNYDATIRKIETLIEGE